MLRRTLFPIFIVFLALTSCQSGGDNNAASSDLDFAYAKNIGDAELSLLGKNYDRIAVDASVYKGLMEMLGVGDKCIDFSDKMKLDVEKVVASKPDLIMLSAYEGADLKKFETLGIPVVKCTDFLETSPLARAEWMRYFGRLWGKGEKADSLFAVVEKSYTELCDKSQSTQPNVNSRPSFGRGNGVGPLFFFDTLYGNIWYQPSPQSTTGKLVRDAGGQLPFKDNQKGGSLSLSAEQVLIQAQNADYWLIRAYGKDSLTLAELAKLNPIYSQFKAFKEGNVFVCYTDRTHYFEETPFRPDWLLKDIKAIFTTQASGPPTPKGGVKLRYFQRIK